MIGYQARRIFRDSAAESEATRHPTPALAGALLLSAIPALVRALYYPDYPGTDDSFIHAAIIENLAAGWGWGINPGEPVNLSTSPLFTLIMLAVSRVWPDVMAAGSAISVAAISLSIFGTFVVAGRITNSAAVGLCAAALATANVHLWRWAGTFIEAPLAYAGVIAILVAFDSLYRTSLPRAELGRFAALGFSIGVLALLRFECGLLGLAFFAHHLVNDRRYLIRRYAAATFGVVVPLAAWAAFAWSTFGTVIPTTFGAKTSPGVNVFNPMLLAQYASVLGSGFFAGFIVTGGAIALLAADGAPGALAAAVRRSVLFVTFIAAILAFYYLKTKSLQSPARYMLPALAVLPLAAAPFLAAAWSAARGWRAAAVAVIVVQLVAAAVTNHVRVAPVLAHMNGGYVAAMSAVAEELNRRCTDGDVVLIEFDIGVVSLRHDHGCRIADGGALASPELRGLTIAQKIEATHARYVVESLGSPSRSVMEPIPGATLRWSREFASHSVRSPSRIFVVRLFEIAQP